MTDASSGHAEQTSTTNATGSTVSEQDGKPPRKPTPFQRVTGSGGDESTDQKRWSAVSAVIGTGIAVAIIFVTTVLLLEYIGNKSPEAALSLVFVSAGVVLILVVCMLAIVLKRLGLANGREAMALPTGSVRAIIALLLIMLFFIASIFLFNGTKNEMDADQNRTLTGISEERYALIPTEQIVSAEPETVEAVTTYDVVLYPASSSTQSSDDIAKQLITTVATLVTAVAAFYFGSSSVAAAHQPLDPKANIATTTTATTPTTKQETMGETDAQDEATTIPGQRTSAEQQEQQKKPPDPTDGHIDVR